MSGSWEGGKLALLFFGVSAVVIVLTLSQVLGGPPIFGYLLLLILGAALGGGRRGLAERQAASIGAGAGFATVWRWVWAIFGVIAVVGSLVAIARLVL